MNYDLGFGTTLFDLNGDLVLSNVSPVGAALGRLSRRSNRYATLDQSAFVDDLGFADGDRTIVVGLDDVTEDQRVVLINVVRNHATIRLAIWDGCYEAVLQTLDPDAGRVSLTFLLVRRLDS